MNLIEKISGEREEIIESSHNIRGARRIFGGAVTGTFLGQILGKSRKAPYVGALIGAFAGLADEAVQRHQENKQKDLLKKWQSHWTPSGQEVGRSVTIRRPRHVR